MLMKLTPVVVVVAAVEAVVVAKASHQQPVTQVKTETSAVDDLLQLKSLRKDN